MGDQHAVHHRRRPEHPDRALRSLEHRPHERGVPQRPRLALRPDDAGDLRRALQLLVPGALLAGAGGDAASAARRSGFHFRAVLRAAAQLSPLRLAHSVSVRQFAGGVRLVRARTRAHAAAARSRHAVRALRDFAAHERSRLSQQEPGRRADLGEQSRRVRARPVGRGEHAASRVRAHRRKGRRRVSPAQHQPAADRERVLQLHPAEARRSLRRAADAMHCAVAASSTSNSARSTSAPSIRSA